MEAERKAAQRAARRRRAITAAVVVVAVIAVMVLISVLGGDDGDSEETSDAAATTTTEPTPSTTAPEKPDVTVPEGTPPTSLQSTDLVVGDGEEAQTGDTLTAHYVGKVYATGEEFDSSYEPREPDGPVEPIEVQLTPGGIIEGWVQGLVGVREGGRRQLVIPPDLGYGEQGQPPDIPANSTLVFVIDVLAVEKAGAAAEPPAEAPAQPGG
jgi:peptidylprolyl isomerase